MKNKVTNKDLEIKSKLQILANKDKLFFTKHKLKEIEDILGLKPNTLANHLSHIKLNIFEEREKEFINYIYEQDLKTLTLEKIQEDTGFKHKQSVTKKIKKIFGVSLEDLKKEIK